MYLLQKVWSNQLYRVQHKCWSNTATLQPAKCFSMCQLYCNELNYPALYAHAYIRIVVEQNSVHIWHLLKLLSRHAVNSSSANAVIFLPFCLLEPRLGKTCFQLVSYINGQWNLWRRNVWIFVHFLFTSLYIATNIYLM